MRTLSTLLLSCLMCVFIFASALKAEDKPAKILYFTKSARFEHTVVKQTDGKPSFSENILNELGKSGAFTIETTKDGSKITPEYMAQFDAIIFYTSGDLTKAPALDKSPPMTDEGKKALIDAVEAGKPFIAVHNALATFDRNKDAGYIDPYVKMLGGESIGHGAQQKAVNRCVDAKFPGADKIGDQLNIMEEWYSNKNFAKDLHVILVQETAGMNGALYVRPPYPSTWARIYGKGRVFVTSLGHREDVWDNPAFKSLLNGGIQWALGRVQTDITPNIESVTPQYATKPAPAKKDDKKTK